MSEWIDNDHKMNWRERAYMFECLIEAKGTKIGGEPDYCPHCGRDLSTGNEPVVLDSP